MRFACPSCSRMLHVADELAGKKVKCGACNSVVQVPPPVATEAAQGEREAADGPVLSAVTREDRRRSGEGRFSRRHHRALSRVRAPRQGARAWGVRHVAIGLALLVLGAVAVYLLAPGHREPLTVDLGGGVTMELILIPPGTFDMGSERGEPDEKPVHKVTLKKGFYIGKYEVTQEQWQAVMGTNPSHFKDPKKPVETVSWDACRDFVAKLSDKTRRKLSLPSEAEWEYACRAGSTTEFCYGDDAAGLGEYAWYKDNSDETTHRVGQKKPNKWGLFDMHGNVWEWCEDVWRKSYEGGPSDGSAWVEGENQGLRVLRGGSWGIIPAGCRSATRFRLFPSFEVIHFGCRVVLRDF